LPSSRKKEEILLKELDITGTAFEDLQEQNGRLLDQLKQKDEANFKIITDYQQLENQLKTKLEKMIELKQYNDNLKIEMKLQTEIISKVEQQNDNLTHYTSELEAKIKCLATNENALQQKVTLKDTEISELNGEISSVKISGELLSGNMLSLEGVISDERTVKRKLLAQIRSLQNQLSALGGNPESGSRAVDEDVPLLLEEIKEFKQKLTCPCCSFRRKNAILLRCYHVFCLECLTLRYETRQRKCPKCNLPFGPNDFKKIYLD